MVVRGGQAALGEVAVTPRANPPSAPATSEPPPDVAPEPVPEAAAAADAGAAPIKTPVPQGYVRGYRAVSEAEYQDILATGRFNQGPNAVEGKYFADSLEGATAHGESLFGSGKYRLIEADVPENAPSLMRWENLDRKGPARFYDLNDLKDVIPRPVE
jgi:hypothetical protein